MPLNFVLPCLLYRVAARRLLLCPTAGSSSSPAAADVPMSTVLGFGQLVPRGPAATAPAAEVTSPDEPARAAMTSKQSTTNLTTVLLLPPDAGDAVTARRGRRLAAVIIIVTTLLNAVALVVQIAEE